jgi:hypothetical protein
VKTSQSKSLNVVSDCWFDVREVLYLQAECYLPGSAVITLKVGRRQYGALTANSRVQMKAMKTLGMKEKNASSKGNVTGSEAKLYRRFNVRGISMSLVTVLLSDRHCMNRIFIVYTGS